MNDLFMSNMNQRFQGDTISITIRCYVIPSHPPQDFDLGKTFSQQIPCASTLKWLTHSLLGASTARISLIAVNGKLIEKGETILNEGDHIDVFPVVGGG
jgi:sulfur carrier protein ThiS